MVSIEVLFGPVLIYFHQNVGGTGGKFLWPFFAVNAKNEIEIEGNPHRESCFVRSKTLQLFPVRRLISARVCAGSRQ